MTKLKGPSSEESGLAGRSVHSKRSLGKTLALGGVLYMGMYAGGGVSDAIEAKLQNSARAEAKEVTSECRDAVLCTLTKISQANQSEMNPNVKGYKTLRSIHLGAHECRIGQTDDGGFVIAIGKTLYLAGQTESELECVISEVNKNLDLMGNSRGRIGNTMVCPNKKG